MCIRDRFNIYNSKGTNILEGNTKRTKAKTKKLSVGEKINVEWSFPNILAKDTYTLSVSCCNSSITEFYDWLNEAKKFEIDKSGNTAAQVDPPIKSTVNQ